ncbi:hypothetical protein [Streptomyces sp. SLBN-31]|uniref:hypothetical protein n=1 Tax=Streptomyces sp. SLBN-31 TaxID=2768444 RepID=UPI0011546026|nr:hypothetical protein [Streptomyces sp. SLBN-31]TQJ92353.1 hypothetical protein FBY22_3211 [Streptomyces sp. SLBN-31]
MTVHVPGHPATSRPRPVGRHPIASDDSVPHSRRRGAPPEEGEFVRPLNRRQVDDRMWELDELYERTSSCAPREPANVGPSGRDRCTAFQQRLADHVRRPGFELLVAEAVGPSGARDLTACAYGFPVHRAGSWWRDLDGHLPEDLLDVAAVDGLFAIADILVERRVRTQDQTRDWNLARRLQKRLLRAHTGAVGVTLVDRCDMESYRALQAWGWRPSPAETWATSHFVSHRLLVLR